MYKFWNGAVFLRFLWNTRGLNIWSFLIIVVKSYSYKYGDVRNLGKFEYLYDYFRHKRNVQKYDLSSDLRLFRPVIKVKHLNNCEEIFYFKHMGLFLTCQGIWGLRDRTIWFSERGFFPSQCPGNFLLDSVFLLGLLFTQKNQQHTCYLLL